MVNIPLGKTTYRRRDARSPEVSLVNCMIEASPVNAATGFDIIQRSALRSFTSAGDGPIRGIFRRDGALGGVFYAVSDEKLYNFNNEGTAFELGIIAGSEMVSIDASSDRMIIVSDNVAWSWDGVTVTRINMPGNVRVSSVTWINGYFILTQTESQRFWWIAPGETDPDPLSFASAEGAPDNLVRGIRLLDELWLFGTQTTEVFQTTGNADAPFQPIGGRLYEKGCANKASISPIDNTLFWVGNDLIVYRADTTPQRISDHSIEERLRKNGAFGLTAWSYAMDGHTIYALTIGDEGTFAFDVESASWPRFKSYGRNTWRARVGAQTTGDVILAGDDVTGDLWILDNEISVDAGEPFEREVTGGIAVVGPPVKCANVALYNAASWAPITGNAANPIIAMRYSDDGGNIFSSWLEEHIGLQGQYLNRTVWRSLGICVTPGRIFTWRLTDDCRFRASYALMNDDVQI